MTIAIYPGSFDPITLGHVDIVTRANGMFDKVVMAVVGNPSKTPRFSVDERVRMVRESVSALNNVSVQSFEGLTVELAKECGAGVIIRGLRAMSDFEIEFAMFQMNKRLSADIETVFMMAGVEYQFLSSSMVKEVARFGGDVSGLVPSTVNKALSLRGLDGTQAGLR